MKTLFAALVLLILSASLVLADQWVNGYTRKDGTYVGGHYRSSPDSNPYNNYSFPGNTNPYTGKVAPGNPDTYINRYNSKPAPTNPSTNSNPFAPANPYRPYGR